MSTKNLYTNNNKDSQEIIVNSLITVEDLSVNTIFSDDVIVNNLETAFLETEDLFVEGEQINIPTNTSDIFMTKKAASVTIGTFNTLNAKSAAAAFKILNDNITPDSVFYFTFYDNSAAFTGAVRIDFVNIVENEAECYFFNAGNSSVGFNGCVLNIIILDNITQ